MATQSMQGAPSAPSAEPRVATIAEGASRWEHRLEMYRLETLEARLERLEKAHEGLQDALYRHEVLQDRNNGDGSPRIGPAGRRSRSPIAR